MYKIFAHQAGILGTFFSCKIISNKTFLNREDVTSVPFPLCAASLIEGIARDLSAKRVTLLYARNNFIAYSTLAGFYGMVELSRYLNLK